MDQILDSYEGFWKDDFKSLHALTIYLEFLVVNHIHIYKWGVCTINTGGGQSCGQLPRTSMPE